MTTAFNDILKLIFYPILIHSLRMYCLNTLYCIYARTWSNPLVDNLPVQLCRLFSTTSWSSGLLGRRGVLGLMAEVGRDLTDRGGEFKGGQSFGEGIQASGRKRWRKGRWFGLDGRGRGGQGVDWAYYF